MVNFLIIQDIYSDVIFRIVHANSVSHIFANDIVVKQSENLSNLSFSLYSNNLQGYLENAKGFKSINSDIENEWSVYLKKFLLLYADDTILLEESSDDLQLLQRITFI
jgi:hypothetical protein